MNFINDTTLKKVLYTLLVLLVLSIIVVVSIYLWYGDRVYDENNLYSYEEAYEKEEREIKPASFTEDKNINEVKENTNTKIENDVIESNNQVAKESKVENVVKEKKETKKELKFISPVDGEIIKDFANETLVYSKTLDEWTSHLGIDIKGEKTSIVKSAEDGKIESIKNDPRYGLTITIVHQDGFKTVYSNLLTTEFVKEGDSVSKGDTIATIGETASFEVLDEPHLHFEMYKDEQAVNPTIYLK